MAVLAERSSHPKNIIDAQSLFEVQSKETKKIIPNQVDRLRVRNPYFNMLHLYQWVIKEGFLDRNRLKVDFRTSLEEDLQGGGQYNLWLVSDENDTRLVGQAYEEHDLVDLSLNASYNKRDNHQDYYREWAESLGTEELKRMLKELPVGSQIFWTSPPGKIEDGYRWQTSISYFGKITAENQLEINLYVHDLDLEGHKILFEKLTGETVTEVSDLFFVASPKDISTNSQIFSHTDLFGLVKDISQAGYNNPEANLQAFMDETVFARGQDQIEQATAFLAKVISQTYFKIQDNLQQADLEKLELAYNFAYRAVKEYSNRQQLLSVADLYIDWQTQINLQNQINNKKIIYDQEQLNSINQRFSDNYGDLAPTNIGGRGCPGGGLAGLGFFWAGSFLPDNILSFGGSLEDDRFVWKCESCGFRNQINVLKGIYKEKCDNCPHRPAKCA